MKAIIEKDMETPDLILTDIPKFSDVMCARISFIESDDYSGYILSVDTPKGIKMYLKDSLSEIKNCFDKDFYVKSKWKSEK